MLYSYPSRIVTCRSRGLEGFGEFNLSCHCFTVNWRALYVQIVDVFLCNLYVHQYASHSSPPSATRDNMIVRPLTCAHRSVLALESVPSGAYCVNINQITTKQRA